MEIKPIGVIKSEFTSVEHMPIQPKSAEGHIGEVHIYEEFVDGLKDLDGFSHIYLLYFFHKVKEYKLRVVPFLDTAEHGIFATRAPVRPNPVGISIVKLLTIDGNVLTVDGIDVLDDTPLIDIKPYVERFDKIEAPMNGWLDQCPENLKAKRSDNRFK